MQNHVRAGRKFFYFYIFLHKNTFHCVFNNNSKKKLASWCANGNGSGVKNFFNFILNIVKYVTERWLFLHFIWTSLRFGIIQFKDLWRQQQIVNKNLEDFFTDWIKFTIFSCPFAWSIPCVLFLISNLNNKRKLFWNSNYPRKRNMKKEGRIYVGSFEYGV